MAGELELCADPAQAGFGIGSFLPLILYLHLGRTILCRFSCITPLCGIWGTNKIKHPNDYPVMSKSLSDSEECQSSPSHEEEEAERILL